MEIVVFILIVGIIILLGFGLFLLFQRWQNRYKIQQVERQKEKLFDMTIFDEVAAAEKLSLTDAQKAVFDEVNQRWQTVTKADFATLETTIMMAESLNARPNKVFAAKRKIASANQRLAEMEKTIFEIRQTLAKLQEKA
ncbi:septation ring formation regulator EzrA [Enterococcus sp. HY326]|uniref:septation ring formation regulator EzrA n=1 Tax=Enterococcus sp. HY326 TaxID=2971265 RepID=UPI00223E9C49|nr:septation ring formation regulator EzrA [Enterococcus sp. HY326]